MELASFVDEVLVCHMCGDKGFPNAFIYCVNCLEFAIHRYCLDVIPETSDELVIWFCEDCKPAGPYKLTLPKDEPLQPQKENPTNSALVKTTTKKKKIVPLVAQEDKVSCLEEATKPNCERVSPTKFPLKKAPLMSDPRRYVVLGLAKGVSQKQSPESAQLDNCFPLKTSDVPKPVKTTLCKKKPKKKQKKKKKIIPLVAGKDTFSCPQEFCEDWKPAGPYKLTLLKDDPLQPQKENPTNSALVKTTLPQKKRQKKRITKKRKIVPLVAQEDKVSCLEEATKPNCERVSPTKFPLKKAPLMSDPRRYVVLGLAKGVSQKQSPESAQLDNRFPLKSSDVPKPVKTTLCKKKPKKKQKKKKKIIPLVAGKDTFSCPQEAAELNHECFSPKNSPLNEVSVKLISEPNQICSPLEVSAIRERDATSLAETTHKHKTQKTSDPVQHSSCDSSCSNVNIKDTEDMSHSVEDQGLELKYFEGGNEKLVSDSSFSEKEFKMKTEDNDAQVGTVNHMRNEQNVSVDRDGVDASKSANIENNLQYIPDQPARPVLEPVWRGSFDITQTDYDLFEGFVGHLSSKACYMVCAEATTLPSMLSLQMQPKTNLWPKSFLECQPSDENIALYFFPGNPKNERGFEQLVNDMIDEDLAMRATAKNAELLIFTSRVLPQSFWRFQGNYYLWGVFRGKRKDCPSPVNAATNTSNNCGQSEISLNEITDGKEILTKVKTRGSGSPQSPLCNYR